MCPFRPRKTMAAAHPVRLFPSTSAWLLAMECRRAAAFSKMLP
jgi:hypothetical protein